MHLEGGQALAKVHLLDARSLPPREGRTLLRKVGIWQLALSLLAEMAVSTAHQNTIVCNAVLSAYKNDGTCQLTQRMLTKMV